MAQTKARESSLGQAGRPAPGHTQGRPCVGTLSLPAPGSQATRSACEGLSHRLGVKQPCVARLIMPILKTIKPGLRKVRLPTAPSWKLWTHVSLKQVLPGPLLTRAHPARASPRASGDPLPWPRPQGPRPAGRPEGVAYWEGPGESSAGATCSLVPCPWPCRREPHPVPVANAANPQFLHGPP